MQASALATKLLNRASHLSYQQKIMLIILTFTLIPLMVFGPLYLIREWNSRVNEIIDINRDKLRNGVYNVNYLLVSSCVDISYISDNSELNTILTTNPAEDFDSVYSAYHIMREILAPRTELNGYINNKIKVYAFDKSTYNGEYSDRMELLDESIKNEVLKTKNIIWRFFIQDNYPGKESYIGLYKLISSIDKPLGITEIKIPFKNIVDSLKFDIPEQAFIAYVAADNRSYAIIKSNNIKDQGNPERVLKSFFQNGNNEQYYVISEKININSDRIIMFIPKSYIYSELNGNIILCLILIALVITAIIFSIKLTAMMATKKLTSLMNLIDTNIEKLMEVGDFPLMQGNDEFSKIDKKFFELVDRIKDYYRKLNVSELDKKALELALLQERINPHLLYNSLSSIKWAFPNETLAHVIDSMVKYYRACLNRGNEILKVHQEISMIDEYIKIQKFAYRLDLSCEVDINDDIMECIILKHTLQPIVENAILHGINGTLKKGIIRIKGRFNNGLVEFCIEDNGAGMTQDKVSQILNSDYQGLYGGYGIKNMARRLNGYFGGDFKLDITSRLDIGTTVTLSIPIIKDKSLLE